MAPKIMSEDIIQLILAKKQQVNRDLILEELEVERRKSGNLIDDETLLRLIAARYGIETVHGRFFRKISISNLLSGLNDVTVTGRVVEIYPPKTFKGENSGKLSKLTIVDRSGALQVVLWNDKVDLVELGKIRVGQIVRFVHGYTREDWKGKAELHLGRKSQVDVEPENVELDEYPPIK